MLIVSIVCFFAASASAQTYYGSPGVYDRVVSQKSSGSYSSEYEVKPDSRPAWARMFPSGASSLPNSSSRSSFEIDTGSYRSSSYKSDTTTSYPTYDVTGPTITTYRNTSSSNFEEKRQQILTDYYGRPIISSASAPLVVETPAVAVVAPSQPLYGPRVIQGDGFVQVDGRVIFQPKEERPVTVQKAAPTTINIAVITGPSTVVVGPEGKVAKPPCRRSPLDPPALPKLPGMPGSEK